MESQAAYSDRKARESALLRAAPQAPWAAPPPHLDPAAVAKLTAFRAVDHHSAAARFPETNWTGEGTLKIGDHRFQWGYQRFDLKIDAPPVYPALPPSGRDSTVFTCSGMAALAVVFLGLERLLAAPLSMWSLRDAYFESQQLAARYADHLSLVVADTYRALVEKAAPPEAKALLHIDSICADLADLAGAADDQRVVMAVFDTTCFARTDPRIADIVEILAARGRPTLLVRSHLKLDTLGLEGGRLGSLVFHEPRLADPAVRSGLAGLRALAPDLVRSVGVAPRPDSFFPTSDTAELLVLSALRAARAAENCGRLADRLDHRLPRPFEVRCYQHRMFFSLHHPDWRDAAPIKQWIASTIAAHTARGGCAAAASSFGFDFAVLSDVMDIPSGRFALRLAPSDEPWPRMRELADRLVGSRPPAWLAETAP